MDEGFQQIDKCKSAAICAEALGNDTSESWDKNKKEDDFFAVLEICSTAITPPAQIDTVTYEGLRKRNGS